MAQNLGYDDTPLLPNSKFHVHDGYRPHPPIVTPGTPSTATGEPGMPPGDAVVLFDGKNLDQWIGVNDDAVKWKVENGYMEVVPKSGNIKTRALLGDCQLHVEWAAPTELTGTSQQRGNSGIFLMSFYEVQVLDCYDNPTYADGVTGGIYGQWPPLANACRRPGEWQVYDIIWEGPRFDNDQLVRPAFITVILNGVVVQNHTQLIGPTTYRDTVAYTAHPSQGPLMLQDHKNPVRFRNIWYRLLGSNSL